MTCIRFHITLVDVNVTIVTFPTAVAGASIVHECVSTVTSILTRITGTFVNFAANNAVINPFTFITRFAYALISTLRVRAITKVYMTRETFGPRERTFIDVSFAVITRVERITITCIIGNAIHTSTRTTINSQTVINVDLADISLKSSVSAVTRVIVD
jgi:hypothetical protein